MPPPHHPVPDDIDPKYGKSRIDEIFVNVRSDQFFIKRICVKFVTNFMERLVVIETRGEIVYLVLALVLSFLAG